MSVFVCVRASWGAAHAFLRRLLLFASKPLMPIPVPSRPPPLPACLPACLPARRYREQPTLPFNAYGTMAIAREEFEANSGSSQFFWLLKVGSGLPEQTN